MTVSTPAAIFDAAFRVRTPELACRPERKDDRAFLLDLFMACSPLAGMLPAAMLHQQAALQYDAYAGTFPHAMRRIAILGEVPIGRLIVDWGETKTHCVDIAVLPDHRATGAGQHLLRTWLSVADTLGLRATLEVRADNPVMRLYARLGFVVVGDDGVMVAMTRPTGSAAT